MSEVTDIESARAPKPESAEQQAARYKARAVKILGDLMDVMRESEKEDFRIEFTIQRDPLGAPYFIGPIIVKRFP
jgi:hypothetical protein